jgi:superfamily II DNA or RNA helicase
VVREKIEIDYLNKSGILKCSNPQTFRLIREHFSVPTPNYKTRNFNIRKYVITPAGAFEVGLWHEINSFILTLNKQFDITFSDQFKKVYRPSLKNVPILSINGYNYYDYQIEAIQHFFKNGRGICLIFTGGGKSLCVAGMTRSLLAVKPDAKIVVMVPTTGLLNQLYNDFNQKFDLPIIERWGDGHIPEFTKPVLVVGHNIMWQDINYTVSVLKEYDYVIIDECHLVGEKEKKRRVLVEDSDGKKRFVTKDQHQISKILHNIPTPHKFGLTATLPVKNKEACWNILGKIGPVLYMKSSYEGRQQGTVTEVAIKVIYCQHTDEVPEPFIEVQNEDGTISQVLDKRPSAKYNEERKFLYRCEKRNGLIRKICTKMTGNGMILIDNIEQGEILKKILETTDRIVYFIWSDVKSEERAKIIDQMENQTGIICIAMSKCFSTGISINNLHWLVLPGVGKSGIKIMQSIGRSMRLHESKNLATVFDIADDTTYAKAHLKERLELYVKEKIEYKSIKQKL